MGQMLWGYDGDAKEWRRVIVDASGHLQVDALSVAEHSVDLYGYDGTNWQTLLVESSAFKNLRVKLYDGAGGMGSVYNALTMPYATRGLPVYAALMANDGSLLRILDVTYSSADARSPNFNALFTHARLEGYNGATWDRLRVDASKNLMVNVGAPLDGTDVAVKEQGTPVVHTQGHDGSNWQNIPLYSTESVKVTPGKGGLLTSHGNASRAVKASAGEVHWITIYSENDDKYSVVYLKDGENGGTIVWQGGVFDGKGRTLHALFSPPIECSTGIYVLVAVEATGTVPYVTIGYK